MEIGQVFIRSRRGALMKKHRDENIIKRWYKLTQPNKGAWAGQIITYIIYTTCLFLLTIFAARTINFMYHKNWTMAFLNLGIELLLIIARCVAIHFEYRFYAKQHRSIKNNVSKKLYNKILILDDKKEKEFTRERITNIALNNMGNMAEFPDAVAIFFGYSIQVIITLFTVYFSNWIAGLIITLLGVVNFFVYYNFNKKLGSIMRKRHEKTDEMFKAYTKVLNGKSVINEYHIEDKYEKEILSDVDKFSQEYSRYYTVYSCKAHLYYSIWNVVVYAVAALMLFFVSKGTLEMAIYLIIVPYLTTCTDKLNTLFERTSSLENMRVDVDRFNLILDMDEKQLIKYGQLNKNGKAYNLGLIDVSCDGGEDAGKILSADLSFKMNSINLIKGEKGSGKRVVFNLLRRDIMPEKGMILLDNLDLYDYNEKTFKNHINYCASHPVFIKGSIKENLLIANNDFEEVKKICEQLGVSKNIERYEKGYNTEIESVKSSGTLFLIGLARALLSNCRILMIYEIPQDTPESFRKKILKFLQSHDVDKTIILFSHSDMYDDVAELTYVVNNGKVKLEKVKK